MEKQSRVIGDPSVQGFVLPSAILKFNGALSLLD